MDARRDRIDRRVHPAVVRVVARVEHHRDDEHDDVRGASRLGTVRRGPETACCMGSLHELADPGSSPTCDRPSLMDATTR